MDVLRLAVGQEPQNTIIKSGPGWNPKVQVEAGAKRWAGQGWLHGVEVGGQKVGGKKAKILSK